MPKAEGKTFSFLGEDAIETGILETIDFHNKEREFVRYETDEFSAVCPFSGLPDIGKVTIEYIPSDKIIELKSLKYYFVSFRNVGIYQEKATQRIFDDLFELLKPIWMKITVVYKTRGGIDATTIIEKGER
ncbi:preQ(1) synthase [Athalassotoga saccharophila]|uniref:preQ(1) synthase n=1 Tax=Athalassotoga saccharophila TaxID=1441386 RepID=UPI00137B7B23|nr:preQ(1) synthase [Athalassotoga saccharophila]BBJ27601.1 NADPH-dependent 7-cyano-7-deazaguanine reductase [Athalassotoga saccharophila]